MGSNTQHNQQSDDPLDPGVTIVNMNVEGMPWYRPGNAPREIVSDRETLWLIIRETWKAGLIVATVFALGLIGTMLLFMR